MNHIRPCTVAEIGDRPDLLYAYAAESSIPEIGIPEAQFETYRALEAARVLFPVGSFVDDEMTGFIVPLIVPLPHYGLVTATVESFFVLKPYRDTGVGLRLLRAAEKTSRDRGAKALLLSAPAGGKLAAVLAKSKPYRRSSEVFVRSL